MELGNFCLAIPNVSHVQARRSHNLKISVSTLLHPQPCGASLGEGAGSLSMMCWQQKALQAVQHNGHALEHATADLKADRGFVLEVLAISGVLEVLAISGCIL